MSNTGIKHTPAEVTSFFILFIVLGANVLYVAEGNSNVHASKSAQYNSTDYEALMQNVNMTGVRETMAFLSSIDSRVIGSSGYETATSFILDAFKRVGLENVTLLEYNVAAPVIHGANLAVVTPEGSVTLPLHPLEPNQAHPCMTPLEGIEGQLIYAGDGELEDTEGENLNGSIVMLDFNSQYRWLCLAEFGAKAFIFVEPDFTTPYEAESKSVNAPLNIPRFYATESEAEILMNHLGSTVKLKSYVRYENVEAYNIIGYLPGTDDSLRDEIMAISARYDSYSVVLDMAPGADMSSGISVLIELSRFFKENRPRHPLLFVAFSGQELGLTGARDFAHRFIWGDYWEVYGKRTSLLVNLDLSVENAAVFGDSSSYFYQFFTFNRNWEWASRILFEKYVKDIESAWESLYGKVFPVHIFRVIQPPGVTTGAPIVEGVRPTLVPSPYWTDSEPFALAGGTGISIYTPLAFRLTWRTPLDTYDMISEKKFGNLRHQFEYLTCVFSSVANEGHHEMLINLRDERESGRWVRPGMEGFATLVGQTVRYDQVSGTYKPVPNVTVVLTTPLEVGDPTFMKGLYHRSNTLRIIAKSGNDGIFTVVGLRATLGAKYTGYVTEAYRIEDDGSISYATDLGQYGSGTFPHTFIIYAAEGLGTTISPRYFVVFPCGSLNLFSVELPEIMRNPRLPDKQAQKAYYVTLQILDHRTHYAPLFYGFTIDFEGSIAMVFPPPDVPVEVVIRNEWTTQLIGVLTNASKENPQGSGYRVEAGESLTISPAIFKVARDLYLLDDYRIETLTQRSVGVSQVSYQLHSEAETSLNEATAELLSSRLSTWTDAKEALLYEYKVYPETMGMLIDVVQTTVFFFLLLIPFALLCERFIFQQRGGKRLLAIVFTFILGLIPLYLFHPGFQLAANISALLVGCLVFVMVLPVLGTVFSKVSSIFVALRRKFVERYEVGLSRFSVFSLSISVGIQNMRKRKLRSSMAIISIVLATFGVTLTSAFTPISILRFYPKVGTNPYDGIMIRHQDSRIPLSEKVYDFIRFQLPSSTIISPRAAFYPPALDFPPLWVQSESGEYRMYGLWGVTYREYELGMVSTALTPESRWIEDSDYLACLIPTVCAEQLNVKIGDKVHLNEMELTVIGLFDAHAINYLVDIDGEGITPRDFRGGEDVVIHLYGEYTMILPLRLVLSLGGDIYSISIAFDDTSQIHPFASKIANQFGATYVLVGLNDQISLYTAVGLVTLMGGISTYIPLILCGFMVLNIMLGGVYERTREIGIYSSLGLSPLSVGGLFISESTVYASLASVMGYDLGIVMTILARSFGWVTEEFSFNLTSSMVIYAVLLILISIYMSSVYPVYAASKLVTPSLERKWKMPSSPEGDLWTIPLPFTFTSKEESIGALVFLQRYFGIHVSEEVGDFVARNLSLSSGTVDDKEAYSLEGDFRLAPYSGNIEQRVKCLTTKFAADRWVFNLYMTRSSGHPKLWRKVNYSFVNEIRKRLMTWASLGSKERTEFISEGIRLEV